MKSKYMVWCVPGALVLWMVYEATQIMMQISARLP